MPAEVDLERAGRYLSAYQRVSPLSTGELWAFPTQLRLTVLEDLTDAAERLVRPSTGVEADAAPGPITAEGALLADALADEREDPARVSIAILGLRTIAAHDWKVFVEDASRVDEWLRQDPSGVYPRMEFATRDTYRKAVERQSEVLVASFLDELEGLGLRETTAFAFLSDHGESWGERFAAKGDVQGVYHMHGATLYDEIVQVPLILSAPGALEPAVVESQVRTVDVVPTLLELAGLPARETDGESLLLNDGTKWLDRAGWLD